VFWLFVQKIRAEFVSLASAMNGDTRWRGVTDETVINRPGEYLVRQD
jgi:hypothetical protein